MKNILAEVDQQHVYCKRVMKSRFVFSRSSLALLDRVRSLHADCKERRAIDKGANVFEPVGLRGSRIVEDASRELGLELGAGSRSRSLGIIAIH